MMQVHEISEHRAVRTTVYESATMLCNKTPPNAVD